MLECHCEIECSDFECGEKMIDIYCTTVQLYGIQIRYDVMEKIMDDDFISENDFIKLTFKDGVKCAVRKKGYYQFYRVR